MVILPDLKRSAMALGAVYFRLVGPVLVMRVTEVDDRDEDEQGRAGQGLILMNRPTFGWSQRAKDALA